MIFSHLQSTRALLHLSWRNLGRNRRRSIATGMAVGLGFAAFLVAAGYVYRASRFLTAYSVYGLRSGHFVIYAPDGLERYVLNPRRYSLPSDTLKTVQEVLRQEEAVAFHAPILLGSGLIGNGCKSFPFVATGIEPDIQGRLAVDPELVHWAPNVTLVAKGRGIWQAPAGISPIAVSIGLAKLLGKPNAYDETSKAPSTLADCQSPDAAQMVAADTNVQLASATWDGPLGAIDGEIIGQFSTGLSETNNASVLLPLADLQQLYATDHVTYVAVWVKDAKTYLETMGRIQKNLVEERHLKVELHPWEEEQVSPYYSGTIRFIRTLIGFISSVLAAIIGLSIANSVTMTVIERSQEIGMMRSIGYMKKQIYGLFMLESLLLSLLSMVVGGSLAWLAMLAVNRADIRFYPPGISGGMRLMLIPNLSMTIWAALAVCLITMLATGLAMRRRLSKTIPLLLSGFER